MHNENSLRMFRVINPLLLDIKISYFDAFKLLSNVQHLAAFLDIREFPSEIFNRIL